ncbi:MAG: hypothetical protein HUJ26_12300 [Planctomycetaceae bacterium]|nr:hypothetical protein [Planctomycetaceae bacterium]
MWFTEDAWSPIFLFGGLGVIVAFVAIAQQKMKLMIVALLLGISCGAIYAIEQRIVTDAEQVELQIYELADDFQRDDLPAVLSHFSTQNKTLLGVATAAVSMADIEEDYRITDLWVKTKAENTLAESHFRANVTATVVGFGNVGRQPTRWKVDWRKEAGEWKIIEVTRLSVIGDDEMGILDKQR